jgi:hypothetical protein
VVRFLEIVAVTQYGPVSGGGRAMHRPDMHLKPDAQVPQLRAHVFALGSQWYG